MGFSVGKAEKPRKTARLRGAGKDSQSFPWVRFLRSLSMRQVGAVVRVSVKGNNAQSLQGVLNGSGYSQGYGFVRVVFAG